MTKGGGLLVPNMFDTTKPVIPAIDTLIKQDDGVAHDENADKRFGAKVGDAKGLAALAGNATAARRSALGDKSNVVQLVPCL